MSILSASCILGKRQFTAKPEKDRPNKAAIDGAFVARHNHIPGHPEMECFIFYPNGIVLQYYPIYTSSFIRSSDTSSIKRISWTINYLDSTGRRKESGGYTIDEQKIRIQVFRQTPGAIYGLCEYNGNVINDSTIFISTCNFRHNSNFCRENFYLTKIDMAKPDSTNWLMQKSWYWKN